jgi:signal transduction histidine kinase
LSSELSLTSITGILTVNIREEQDIVAARQQARQISNLLGFNPQDQARISTAVSAITRNALQYAGGGRAEFCIDVSARPQFLWITVSDRGPGISDIHRVLAGSYVSSSGMGIGLVGTRRLMDSFEIESSPRGTTVRFGKALPAGAKAFQTADIGRLSGELSRQQAPELTEELHRQNRELLQALDTIRTREAELEGRQQDLSRLNSELEETNRGVLALYAELDEKAQALRRADELKSRFLSHVSHEFRTPLNAILALARLLLDRVDGELSAEQEKQVCYMHNAAQQLTEIVNDLLDLAKVESGKTEVRLTPIDVGEFLRATRALMRPLASNETVLLDIEEPWPPILFESDESKLGQILRNLISNSLKFTQSGEVRVKACSCAERNAVIFTVRDTGIGISPEDQERIFHEFSQIENPIQRRVKGTGLGLPLSRRLAHLMGGTLTVESAIGAGSTFTLTLPYRAAAAPAPSVSREPQIPHTILVVDDEAASRYLVERLLRGTAYQIIETAGSDAAERARFEMPALIILDLSMPDHDGFHVLDELKSDRATAAIPVIIHTSRKITETDRARFGERIAGILPKGTEGRRPALLKIREILGEPDLFSSEPEFRA